MREIKFRAWDKVRQRMILPGDYDFVTFNGKPGTAYPHSVDEQPMMTSLFEVHLMQYTGLKDKNGKAIFEGDVLGQYCLIGDYAGGYEPHGFVEWDQDLPAFILNKTNGGWVYLYEVPKLEVIGNIYENPELLDNQEGK